MAIKIYVVRHLLCTGLIHKAWKNLEHEAGVTEGRTVKSLYQWSDYVYEEDMDWLHCDDEDFEKPALTGTSAETTIDDKMEGGLKGMELLERVIFKNANVLHCNLRSNIVDTVLWYEFTACHIVYPFNLVIKEFPFFSLLYFHLSSVSRHSQMLMTVYSR